VQVADSHLPSQRRLVLSTGPWCNPYIALSSSKQHHQDPADNGGEEGGLPVEGTAIVGHEQGEVEETPEEKDGQCL